MIERAAMVELSAVTKRFGGFAAVDQVSLSVEAGEFLTLLGPSGCGKTTLLRLIAGFENPDSGTVSLDGVEVTARPPYQRNVNQVFQSYALFPHLNVEENIAFGLRRQTLAKAEISRRTAEAIALVALTGLEQRKPDQLSGGQRQRVALARALAPRPAVLLLDEPLSALDAKLRHSMQRELKRLQRQLGLTFIFVTHDQEEALTMSDRVAVVNHGRIEQIGTPNEIYDRPATAFVAEFVGSTNLLAFVVTAREGDQVRLNVAADFELLLPSHGVPLGESRGSISIRPERLKLSSVFDPSATFSGEMVEGIFTGAHHDLTIRTATGVCLKARVVNGSAQIRQLAQGDRVWGWIDSGDVRVLPFTA